MQNSYKLARTRRHVVGMSCGSRTHIAELLQVSYKLRIARVYLYFVMKCSAHLFKIASLSVRSVLPSALSSGVAPELFGP